MPHQAIETAKGRRILVVEDEFLIAEDLRESLEELGAIVIGPVATVEDAVKTIASREHIDGATLDITLGGEMSFPVAEALQARGLPFVLLTGYDLSALPEALRDAPLCEKPADVRMVVKSLFTDRAAM